MAMHVGAGLKPAPTRLGGAGHPKQPQVLSKLPGPLPNSANYCYSKIVCPGTGLVEIRSDTPAPNMGMTDIRR